MARTKAPAAPDHLTMRLFAPGMSALHRAGLGGLASTLFQLRRRHEQGDLAENALPGPIVDCQYPWEITEDEVTLRFGSPELAGDYLCKLFAFAFQTTAEGLIYLPGQHDSPPSPPILADLQAGLTLTFLQHGRVRALATQPTTVQYDFGDDVPLPVQYRRCTGFRHRDGWEELVDNRGRLLQRPIRVDGPISPGTVVRHVAFTSTTGAEDPPERILPLYFSLVGCLALAVNRGVAALVVPLVENLLDFMIDRPAMTPTSARDCQVANAADAGFRAQVRIRDNPRRQTEVTLRASRCLIPACSTMTFMPTPWASQQKSRVATLQVPPGDDNLLRKYQTAMQHLPPRIVSRVVRETTGRGRERQTTERREAFRSDSVVRPLVAENLACGRRWYAGFADLMTKINPATEAPFRDRLPFERGGLHAMIEDKEMWGQEGDGECLIVQAIHEAMRQRMAAIREETDGNEKKPLSQATKNRWERFRERLRLDLAGAKTEAQVRFALMDLFSRAGNNSVLRTGWPQILPVIRKDWHLVRDLGLLALASYASRSTGEATGDTTTDAETETEPTTTPE